MYTKKIKYIADNKTALLTKATINKKNQMLIVKTYKFYKK